MPKSLPDTQSLWQVLSYDYRDGRLSWRATKQGRRKNGSAGWTGTSGYRKLKVGGSEYYAHRVIWKMVYGTDPDQIDHINGSRLDNRLCNLRSTDVTGNNRNMKRFCTNKSGHSGVYWDRSRDKWAVEIFENNKKKHLGRYDAKADAIAARKAAEAELGYHQNHGAIR